MSEAESWRPVQVIRTGLGYGWAMVSLLFFVPLGLLSLPFDRGQRVHDGLSVLWARGILFFAGARLVVAGGEQVSRAERYVIVANHQSLLDAMVMVAVLQPLTPVRMMAKRSLFRVPLLGWGMRAFGHMSVDHRSLRGSIQGLQQAQSSVRQRWSTVFFPEGTRSAQGRIQPFHNAAFHIAARAGVRVLPVSISNSRTILPKGRVVLLRPGTITVQIHPPLAVESSTPDAVKRAAEQTRQLIQTALGESAPTSDRATPRAH